MKVFVGEPELSLSRRYRGSKQRSEIVFKIIGAAVVYGFALFGLAKYFEGASSESDCGGS